MGLSSRESNLEPKLRLELYEPKPKPERPYGLYTPYAPTFELSGNRKFSPSAYQYLYQPASAITYGPNLKMPMQNVYNITLPGPTGGHVEMSRIYEDILPGKDGKMTFTTLGERLQTWDYIRQSMIKHSEGEDISLDNSGNNSLMSYIKLMELNPNYYSPLYTNPYKGLPYGLLIYRSCFPIKLDEPSQSVIGQNHSIGLNIRLYSMTYAEFYSYKFREPLYIEYDIWREVAYYEYIREKIIKARQSPNFALMYAFFMCPNRKIDFFSLKKKCLTQKDMLTLEYQKFVKMHNLFKDTNQVPPKVTRPLSTLTNAPKRPNKLPDEMDPVLQLYSGTTLIIITEAPHHNMYQWASKIYEREGIVKKVVSNGYHHDYVWYNILFQIIASLYVMQIHGIYIRDMTIQDNIYIKDLQTFGKAKGYWKYIIEGVTYYVPNYGYLVMIDTNFKDIPSKLSIGTNCKREYKIYTSNIFGKKYDIRNIREKIFENYRSIINTNAFTKEHTANDVNRPPASVMKLIESMMKDPETNLSIVLCKYFPFMMNNRIGTYLYRDTEIPNIHQTMSNFTYGEMAAEIIEDDVYKWCLVLENKGDGIMEVITRDNPNGQEFVTKKIRIETLRQYTHAKHIDQNSTLTASFAEEDLIETYILKS